LHLMLLAFDGVILLACISISVTWSLICCSCLDIKISEGMLPSTTILKVLTFLSKMMPKAKLFPYKDLTALIIREPGKRKWVGNFINPLFFNAYLAIIIFWFQMRQWAPTWLTPKYTFHSLIFRNHTKNWMKNVSLKICSFAL
jgi:hypothetical protein